MIEWQKHTSGECVRLADVPAGADVVAINGVEVIGVCEGCTRPILDGETIHRWQDCVTCGSCGGPEDVGDVGHNAKGERHE